MSHVKRMNASCRTSQDITHNALPHRDMPHNSTANPRTTCSIWMIYKHMSFSCHTYEWVKSHVWMGHVEHHRTSHMMLCLIVTCLTTALGMYARVAQYLAEQMDACRSCLEVLLCFPEIDSMTRVHDLHICIYVWIYLWMYIYMNARVCIYIYVHKCIHIWIDTYTYEYIYTNICIYIYIYMYICIYMKIQVNKLNNIHIHIYTYIYIYVHICA